MTRLAIKQSSHSSGMERIATGSLESSPERAYSCYSVCSTSCGDEELRELRCYDRHILLAVDGTVVSSRLAGQLAHPPHSVAGNNEQCYRYLGLAVAADAGSGYSRAHTYFTHQHLCVDG